MNLPFYWNATELLLMPEKVLYIPHARMLIISDWHLGKLGNFRREGFFVPPMQSQEELNRLGNLIQQLDVHKVVFLGDLFHADWNYEWDEFVAYLKRYPTVEFILTKGNHDRLTAAKYRMSSLKVVDALEINDCIVLSHEPIREIAADRLNIVGHLHPAVAIKGKGRQHFRLPCFYLKDNVLTLPAFGKWTGLHLIKQGDGSTKLFAVLGDEVLLL